MKKLISILAKIVISCPLWMVLVSSHAFAQSPLSWKRAQNFDNGVQSTLAMNCVTTLEGVSDVMPSGALIS